MCFFTLYRYRACQHDQVGPFVAFCTTAKARASSNEHGNAHGQPSPQGRYSAHEGSPNFTASISDVIWLSYCGQPLFSPEYINDFGRDSINCGICPSCVEMEMPIVEGNIEKGLRYPEGMNEGRIEKFTRLGGNACGNIGQHKSNQLSQQPGRWRHQQTPTRTPSVVSFQLHALGSGFGNHSIPLPPQPSFHHPLFQNRQPIQRAISTPRWQIPSEFQSCPSTPLIIADSQNPEHLTNLSGILQQILCNYPLRTRLAIEKAVANQPLEQRTKTLQTLRTSFEEKINRRQYVARGISDPPK